MARRWWVWAVAAAVVLVAVLTWALWPSGEPAPRARPYLEYTACLLTDGQGVAGQPAAQVWAGMQDASLATHAKVQYLPVIGEETVANAAPYLASLVQRQCRVVVAVGSAQVAAVVADAVKYPGVRFAVVGGGVSGGNVTSVSATPADGVRARVSALVRDAVHAAAK